MVNEFMQSEMKYWGSTYLDLLALAFFYGGLMVISNIKYWWTIVISIILANIWYLD